MRLDHLLSKEHWPPHTLWWSRAAPRSRRPVNLDGPRASGVVLEGGTLTSSAAGFGRSPVRRHLGGVWNTDRTEYGVVGTLLGPERAGDRFFSCQGHLVLVPLCRLWVCRVRRGQVGGDWSYVENCTVDASIF